MFITTKNIFDLINQRGLTANKLQVDCGLPNSALTAWKKGNANPSNKALQKIANYFKLPISYFYENHDEPIAPLVRIDQQLDHETKKSPSTEAERLTIEQKALLGFWGDVTPPVKEKIKNIIIAMFPEYIDKISQIK